jgi:prepilin-type N-terminal cleavage/methylation domain-containing protein
MKPSNHRQAGFTIVELSVVLVVIGLLLGVTTVGVNLQRSAQTAQLKHKFIDQWKVAYEQYYLRTGTVLGDSPTDPRMMVAGAEFAFDGPMLDGGAPLADGGPGHPETGGIITDGAADIGETKICQGQGYANYEAGIGGNVDASALSAQRLHDLMDRHGIRMPAGRAEGREDRFVYLDHNGNQHEAQVCFQWFPAGTHHGAGNTMVIRGLTPEVARELDVMVDGKADAGEGMFRQFLSDLNDTVEDSEEIPGHEWNGNATFGDSLAFPAGSDNNTTDDFTAEALLQDDFNGFDQPGTAGMDPITMDRGDNDDEDRVMVVTAVWRMDQ